MPENDDQKGDRIEKLVETIVLIILIAVGITVGILYFDDKKDISSVMFAIALASILYKFLGGIGQQNSLKLGFMKLGGSAAVLFGFIYGLDNYIFKEEISSSDILVSPNEGWVPMELDAGRITRVTIREGDEVKGVFPGGNDYVERMQQHEYSIVEKDDILKVVNKISKDTIGFTDRNSWLINNDFEQISLDENEDAYRFSLYPDGEQNSSNSIPDVELPFEIEVYPNSRYKIFVDDAVLSNKVVTPRTGKLIPFPERNKIYIAFIEQANHMADSIENYSKWIVIPLSLDH